ncbi:unnamed protein product [Bursaphelenchus xylophilus]|uniref:(pine wood nematode) hypothetical protein n=1 Tax=Bursaphelenchus xylophilus TaxID=6326 RepID=A0A1I7SL13_BURXY|nr:unnamed protein product [Bursaphelenchus xylophilus]CAG9129332.1 unnamed protein product [Bursaphelenchus xylophilus]
MPPHLVPCPFCDRLFSRFSIGVHQPQCKQNPYRMAILKEQTTKLNNKNKRVPPAKRRSKSVGNTASAPAKLRNATNDERPSTMTIKSRRKNEVPSELPPIPSQGRICFVCGERIESEPLLDHEIECEAIWRTNRRDIPAYIQVRSPKKMRIPSVDGTFDEARIDWYAAKSAEKARKVRCLKCGRIEMFDDAPEHQCARFEPTVQFYF